MLRKVGSFNDLPESVIKSIAPLQVGQVAVYQLLNGTENPLPKNDQYRKADMIYPFSVRIPTRCQIRLDDGRYVDIGVVQDVKDEDVTRTKLLVVRGNDNNGLFHVTGGDSTTEQFYQYLELSQHNQNSPYRDKDLPALYKRVDELAEANDVLDRGSAIQKATTIVDAMNVGEIRQAAAARNWSSTDDPKVLKAKLMKLAIEDPEGFLKFAGDDTKQYKALVKRALELSLISYSPVENKFNWSNGQALATLSRVDGKDELDGIADWINTHTNGPAVYEKLKKMVKNAVKVSKMDDEDDGKGLKK